MHAACIGQWAHLPATSHPVLLRAQGRHEADLPAAHNHPVPTMITSKKAVPAGVRAPSAIALEQPVNITANECHDEDARLALRSLSVVWCCGNS